MEAIALSRKGVESNEGGPFGCIVVKGDQIVGRGNNRVTSSNDPTAHAEIVAIRDACHNLSSFQLEGCEIYTSCEPCPMCLGAIYWARPDRIFYGNSRHDAAEIDFDDSMIYEEITKSMEKRRIPIKSICREEALKIFQLWREKPDKTLY